MTVSKRRDGMAPHKPIFMLTVIDLVEKGHIRDNKIYLDDKLIEAFEATWKKYAAHIDIYKPDITKPFYHLSSEPFYHFQLADTVREKAAYGGVKKLRGQIEYACLDDELWELIHSSPSARSRIRVALIVEYIEYYG